MDHYPLTPKVEILQGLQTNYSRSCEGNGDYIVPKQELLPANLQSNIEGTDQTFDCGFTPIKTESVINEDIIELETNNGDYIVPKQELLDTNLQPDIEGTSQTFDYEFTPIKTESVLNEDSIELQTNNGDDIIVVPKQELLDINLKLNIEETNQTFDYGFKPIKTETVLNKDIIELQKTLKLSEDRDASTSPLSSIIKTEHYDTIVATQRKKAAEYQRRYRQRKKADKVQRENKLLPSVDPSTNVGLSPNADPSHRSACDEPSTNADASTSSVIIPNNGRKGTTLRKKAAEYQRRYRQRKKAEKVQRENNLLPPVDPPPNGDPSTNAGPPSPSYRPTCAEPSTNANASTSSVIIPNNGRKRRKTAAEYQQEYRNRIKAKTGNIGSSTSPSKTTELSANILPSVKIDPSSINIPRKRKSAAEKQRAYRQRKSERNSHISNSASDHPSTSTAPPVNVDNTTNNPEDRATGDADADNIQITLQIPYSKVYLYQKARARREKATEYKRRYRERKKAEKVQRENNLLPPVDSPPNVGPSPNAGPPSPHRPACAEPSTNAGASTSSVIIPNNGRKSSAPSLIISSGRIYVNTTNKPKMMHQEDLLV